MGQKVNPIGFRLGFSQNWRSRWFVGKASAKNLYEDNIIRKYLHKKLKVAGISSIELERAGGRLLVCLFTAKPGIVIGKKGKDIEDLKAELKALVAKEVNIKVVEIRKPDLDAKLIADSISFQLERRVNFRRAMKEATNKAMRAGAEGIKIIVSGRLNGADIARPEKIKEGRIPLHTLRANIDYARSTALTTYGIIGVKVWVCNGLVYSKESNKEAESLLQL